MCGSVLQHKRTVLESFTQNDSNVSQHKNQYIILDNSNLSLYQAIKLNNLNVFFNSLLQNWLTFLDDFLMFVLLSNNCVMIYELIIVSVVLYKPSCLGATLWIYLGNGCLKYKIFFVLGIKCSKISQKIMLNNFKLTPSQCVKWRVKIHTEIPAGPLICRHFLSHPHFRVASGWWLQAGCCRYLNAVNKLLNGLASATHRAKRDAY